MTWVFAALVTAFGQAWADFAVCMPDAWAKDPGRRAKAGIPADLEFKTKPELAIAQVRRLVAAGLGFCWVAANEATAVPASSGTRAGRCRSPMSSSSPATTGSPSPKTRVIRADQSVPDAVFERRSCGNGTTGPVGATGRSSRPQIRRSS